VLNIYAPFFATNTRYLNTSYLGMQPPVMPSWMQANSNPYESPAQMVFACDTVFASDKHDPDVAGNADLAGALGAIENSIVSALNRGIATNYAIPPDNWAAFPQMLSAPIVATNSASQVTATTTYFYAVSAVNVYGETTPGLEVSATLDVGQTATLTWANGANAAPATAYKIYRGTSVNNLTLLQTVTGQQTSFVDTGGASSGGSAPAFQYFTPGTISNWYAAFVQTDSTNDPVNGVSINGLSYGFPYSDQGGVSTNICFAPDNIPANITINLGTISGPSFVTQSLADAVAGTDYQQTLVVSGSGTGTYFEVVDSTTLPSWLSLDPDTGVLSGKAPTTASQTSTFNIRATNSAGSVVMPFSLTVGVASEAPLRLAGSSNNTLTVGTTDVGLSFTMQVQVTGGSGNYTMALTPGVALPTGMVINGLDTGLTSTNGVITLTGSTATSFTAENVGFRVTISDTGSPTVGSLTVTLYILVNPVLQITTSSLIPPVQGKAYWQSLTTNSVSAGVQFAVQPNSLPAGLTLTPWGILSGTPTESGMFSFEVTATDIAGGTTSHTFSDFVVGTTAPSAITFATTTLPVTAPTAICNLAIPVSGGQGSLTLALVNGALPNGLSLAADAEGMPCISGTVSAAPGVYPFTIRATDSVGNAEYQA
jgi:hypothetical protein